MRERWQVCQLLSDYGLSVPRPFFGPTSTQRCLAQLAVVRDRSRPNYWFKNATRQAAVLSFVGPRWASLIPGGALGVKVALGAGFVGVLDASSS